MATDHPCPGCGHSLVGQHVGGRCPECGLLIVPGASITRPRELFILGIRLIGVWYLVGTVDVIVVLGSFLANRPPVGQFVGPNPWHYVATIAVHVVVGVYCLLGAPHLVGMTYTHRLARETAPTDAGTEE